MTEPRDAVDREIDEGGPWAVADTAARRMNAETARTLIRGASVAAVILGLAWVAGYSPNMAALVDQRCIGEFDR